MTPQWELITQRKHHEHDWPVDTTERLKVPGGWLYRVIRDDSSFGESRETTALVFVPDAPDLEVSA